MIESIILCTIVSILIIVSYTLGLKNGQKLKKDEPIQVISNPIENIKEKAEVKRFEANEKIEQEKIEKMLANIDIYDGTSKGQQDI